MVSRIPRAFKRLSTLNISECTAQGKTETQNNKHTSTQ
uniref:Uncharacterized protein n=1 Tax=Anguilla anguilla TaxID=7936 RepID=A0A0E9Q911_ANGAN